MDFRSRVTAKTNQESIRSRFASKLILTESSTDNLGEVRNKLWISIQKNGELPDRKPDHPSTFNSIAPVAMQPTHTEKSRSNIKYQNTVAEDRFVTKPVVESYFCGQLDIDDPDKDFRNDPYMVTEYIQDIFRYMRTLEDKYPIRKGFLDGRQPTPNMREKLVDWLVQMRLKFKMRIETLHMCVSLIDRYTQNNAQVGRDIYQLVGTSAFLIAAKYEETFYPCMYDLKFIGGRIYSGRKILQMERDILDKLAFGLGRPSSIDFLRRYVQIANVRRVHHILGKYMLELALMAYDMCHVKPSLQAAAACCLSMGILDSISDLSSLWTPTLIFYTGYEYAEFERVVVCLAKILINSETSKFQTIRRKYAGPECAKISSISLLKGYLVRKLARMTINQ
nr:G2/mitotic-specific cyclin-B-like [Leptinotarsa decemlineata]